MRSPLERCGVIVARSLHVTGGLDQPHASELARWDQVYPGSSVARADPDPAGALRDLVAAGVQAAVVAPESELARWFSWRWYWSPTLVDDLVRAGRLARVNGHVAAR
jgi:hypothetical protein